MYAGGLDKWQCIEKTLTFFREIEVLNPNAVITLLTRDVDQALTLLNKYKIENKYIEQEELLATNGNSIVYIAKNNEILGIIGVKDIIRGNAKNIIEGCATKEELTQFIAEMLLMYDALRFKDSPIALELKDKMDG